MGVITPNGNISEAGSRKRFAGISDEIIVDDDIKVEKLVRENSKT